jgi:hypothetical protein
MATWASPAGSGDALNPEPLAAPPARLRPGRVWYVLALAVIVAGVACSPRRAPNSAARGPITWKDRSGNCGSACVTCGQDHVLVYC